MNVVGGALGCHMVKGCLACAWHMDEEAWYLLGKWLEAVLVTFKGFGWSKWLN